MTQSLLDNIENTGDLKGLSPLQLLRLCDEIREFIIETILKSGGHFAGNLGAVELSVALHYVFSSPHDALIWDVGHQSYIHKILTGRKNELKNIRQIGGISGFPKRTENIHDIFGTGHSSTAISAATGIAIAKKLKGDTNHKTIAIVGDGALTGGMSFEALNNLMSSDSNLLVIINDNHIGIDPNTGAIDKHLQNINPKQNIFTDFGIPYTGPIDGHDLGLLMQELENSKRNHSPQILHIQTVKGKGYAPAELEQTKWHSASPQFIKIEASQSNSHKKWQDVFGETLLKIAADNPKVVGVTPAMPSSSGMINAMLDFPDRFFDVGIAEQHAVTFSAGLATEGFIPYLNIYSTFLQRGFDQLIHDVALQNLPVIFCIDRAGLVGEDGPTHHGAFDIAFLRPIPNLQILAPMCAAEFEQMLSKVQHSRKTTCIRYPKGAIPHFEPNPIPDNFGPVQLTEGDNLAIISTGIASQFAKQAADKFENKASVWHFPLIKPLNKKAILNIINSFSTIITVEDGCINGGFGESIASVAASHGLNNRFINLGIPDEFVAHGDNTELYELCGYGPKSIEKVIAENI